MLYCCIWVNNGMWRRTGSRFNMKTVLAYVKFILNIRLSWDRFIFIMGIPILARRHHPHWDDPLGLVLISHTTSYCKISQNLEAARFVFRIVRSLWYLAGTSAALLPISLSNFKAIRSFKQLISRLRDFTGFYDKTSWILKQGNGFLQYIPGNMQPWWRHQMETFSALLYIWAGNSPVAGELYEQMPVTRSLDVFFDLRLNIRLSKQSWGWWFKTPSRPL